MASRFPEAEARIFHRVFICRSCKTKVRASPQAIAEKKVVCPKCGSRNFRPKRMKK